MNSTKRRVNAKQHLKHIEEDLESSPNSTHVGHNGHDFYVERQ